MARRFPPAAADLQFPGTHPASARPVRQLAHIQPRGRDSPKFDTVNLPNSSAYVPFARVPFTVTSVNMGGASPIARYTVNGEKADSHQLFLAYENGNAVSGVIVSFVAGASIVPANGLSQISVCRGASALADASATARRETASAANTCLYMGGGQKGK